MEEQSIPQRFRTALDALVEQLRADRSIVATLLCGSLSHDTVWAKSDIDLVLVTIDDRLVVSGSKGLFADGLNVHALLVPRAQFRALAEGSIHNSFVHAFLTKGQVLYTHDPTIDDLCTRLRKIGARDTQIQLLGAATQALGSIYKAHKWFLTRGDLDYTALWILYAATPLAQMEVIARGLVADREVIPRALALNPAFFTTIYAELLNSKKTRAGVQAALDAVDGYVAERIPLVFGLVLEYLRQAGEPRSATEIDDHFKRSYDVVHATGACEYLADQGLVGKASTPVRLTKKSSVEVQELAFFHIPGRGAAPPADPDEDWRP